MPTTCSLDSLRDELAEAGGRPVEWVEKMVHRIPQARSVDRLAFLLGRCKGKRVLNLGCASGPLHGAIGAVAAETWGIDREPGPWHRLDLDDPAPDLPEMAAALPDVAPELIVAGEVLEHLANPGRLLLALRQRYGCELLVTAPNALGASAAYGREGIECVNRDHVAWYSWRTMATLLERCGYAVREFAWYGGRPVFAEGVIFVAQPMEGEA